MSLSLASVWAYCLWLSTKAAGSSIFIFFEQETSLLLVLAECLGYDFFINLYYLHWCWRLGTLVRGEHPNEQAMWNGRRVTLRKMLLGGQIIYFHSITSYYFCFWDRKVESILNILTIYIKQLTDLYSFRFPTSTPYPLFGFMCRVIVWESWRSF